MMEFSISPASPILDLPDDVAESSQTDDADEGPESLIFPVTSESPAPQDPVLPGRRNKPRKTAIPPSTNAGKKPNQSKAAATKPSISLLICSAFSNSQKKSGLSLQAIKKLVVDMGYDMTKKKHYFLRAIRNMVAKGQLRQLKGTGATGSFKINPDFGKKNLPKMKGKGPNNKQPEENKKSSAKSKNVQETAKKQAKADVKKACKTSKRSSVQATTSQVKV